MFFIATWPWKGRRWRIQEQEDVRIWFRSRNMKDSDRMKRLTDLLKGSHFVLPFWVAKINNIKNANLCIHNNFQCLLNEPIMLLVQVLFRTRLTASFRFPQMTRCLPFQFSLSPPFRLLTSMFIQRSINDIDRNLIMILNRQIISLINQSLLESAFHRVSSEAEKVFKSTWTQQKFNFNAGADHEEQEEGLSPRHISFEYLYQNILKSEEISRRIRRRKDSKWLDRKKSFFSPFTHSEWVDRERAKKTFQRARRSVC